MILWNHRIKQRTTALFQCFHEKLLKSNTGECHLLISSNETFKVGEYETENSECEKLLGVKLDWKLNSDDCISHVCRKDRGKLNFRQNYRAIEKAHTNERVF